MSDTEINTAKIPLNDYSRVIGAAVADLERLLADPSLGEERPRLLQSRIQECVREIYRVASLPLDLDLLQEVFQQHRGYVGRTLEQLGAPDRAGSAEAREG